MKASLAVVFILAAFSAAGRVAVDLPGRQRDDWLEYDNGTFNWLAWEGTYRGVWFNLQDFIPGGTCYDIGISQMWFYHDTSYPWDTSDFYMELWNGDTMGPMTRLDQTMVTAHHLTPVYTYYNPPIETEQNFWALANTEMSAGGCPSILVDDAQGSSWGGVAHSFYSDDFTAWEPWVIGDGPCNYFISVTDPLSLEATTWGSIKTVF